MDLERLFNVEEFETAARGILPEASYVYVSGGAGAGRTARANCEAFDRWTFMPRVLVDVQARSLETTVVGQRVACPILIAPYSQQALLHPEAELATARAASAAGVLMGVSMGANRSLEEIAQAADCALWFQPYLDEDRGLMREMADRAVAAGYAAICLTVDAPVGGWREGEMRHRAVLPPGEKWANMPERLLQPGAGRWLNGAGWDWGTLDWMRSVSPLPIVLKGVVAPEDAKMAVEHGAAAVVVSNHGGRQLDDTIATLDALPAVVEAVEGRIEVLLDGGIRRGTDVLKALALGARGVLIARAAAWGLAVGGQAGVQRVLSLLTGELSSAMAIAGVTSVEHVPHGLLVRRPS
jgi:4-hydroxymandelate oxidase